jgi:uncharacterized protein (TIGR04255 family)
MASHRWLSRAPLVEARVEIGAVFAGEVRDGVLDAIAGKLSERYPRVEHRGRGLRRLHGDAPHVVEASSEGLRVSRLAPYAGFGPLVGEALWAWERTLEVARPRRVRRIAVRFDNRFQLPRGVPLDRLFAGGAALDEVVARVALDQGARAVVTQREEEAEVSGDRVCFVLDIAVDRAVDLPPESDAVWRSLGELAAMEHRIFFESVTDEALAPYVCRRREDGIGR